MLFQGIGTSIDMKPYIFVIFQGGGGVGPPVPPPSGSAHGAHKYATFGRNKKSFDGHVDYRILIIFFFCNLQLLSSALFIQTQIPAGSVPPVVKWNRLSVLQDPYISYLALVE